MDWLFVFTHLVAVISGIFLGVVLLALWGDGTRTPHAPDDNT